MKYEFPYQPKWDELKYPVGYFSYYLEEKNGKTFSEDKFGRYASIIARNRDKHLANNPNKTEEDFYEELKYLMWGVFNTKDEVRSPAYCFYFWDNLDKYKRMKKDYEADKDEIEYKESQTEVEDKIKEHFSEFLGG